MLEKLFEIPGSRKNRIRTQKALWKIAPINFKKQIDRVYQKSADHENADILVNRQRGLISAEDPAQLFTPRGLEIHSGQPGCSLNQKREHQKEVENSLHRTEPFDSILRC